MAEPPSSPTGWGKRTLRERYVINEEHVLGEGGMATVYKGLDNQTCRNVAVKMYSTEPGDFSGLSKFVQSVKMMRTVGTKSGRNSFKVSRRGSFVMDDLDLEAYQESIQEAAVTATRTVKRRPSTGSSGGEPIKPKACDFLQSFDVSKCFVELLDFSKTEDGDAGMDAQDDTLWLIFEVGEESLADFLADLSDKETSMKPGQLRDLQWTLVSMVWGLHSAGYVHLDIKPQNIMRFHASDQEYDQWKLIDLDGVVLTGETISLDNVTYTPEYMPPELAHAFVYAPDNNLITSRLMDVWSVGMCVMEAIFLQPILAPFYEKWREETGNNDKFFNYLATYEDDPIMDSDMKDYIGSISEDMAELLGDMLAKDPSKRCCIGHCLAHKWFEPVRSEILQSIAQDKSGGGKLGMSRAATGSFGAKSCVVM